MRKAWHLAWALPVLGVATFVGWKARAVGEELVNPPFYRPQPIARVEATYADLAKGGEGDPGGTWSSSRIEGRELWLLKRSKAKGVVLLLHGFGDDRWGTSPALRWFPDLDAAIFTYLGRDESLRAGRGPEPYITFGAKESDEVVSMVHALERAGYPRTRILLMGRSLGASVGLLALAKLEAEPRGPLGGLIWEGAPLGSRDFAERLVRGPKDRTWHLLAPAIGGWAAHRAAARGGYEPRATDPREALRARRLRTPSLCFLALQDRLAPPPGQREMAAAFTQLRLVEVDTWHLHCAEVLGPAYAQEIRRVTAEWIPQ